MRLCGFFSDAKENIDIPHPSIMKPVELWSGKQLMTMLLKPNRDSKLSVNCEVQERNYTNKAGIMCPNDGYVIIQDSEVLSGNLGKKTLGDGSKEGLFYSLIKDNSNAAAARVMLRLSKFTSRWIMNYGMSIGISDVTPSKEVLKNKQELITNGLKQCEMLIDQMDKGTLKLDPGCDAEKSLENNMNGALSKIREKVGTILKKTLPDYNAPLIMSVSGAKGNDGNMCQMIACVGQQIVNAQRIPNGFINRTLPHFEPMSVYPAAKGFVENSFYSGLNATEFFFHTIAGRVGLVDTAVKTAETGYMQRRLVKALEDLAVKYEYSVRNSKSQIIQFLYGDDGLDPIHMEKNEKPVSFSRLLKKVQQKHRSGSQEPRELCLTPYQIEQIMDTDLEIKRDVTEGFISDLRSFIQTELIER